MTFDEALRELYQTPHERFVAERKRLADDLRTGGDREGAARLAKLARPTVSSWAVNQLYWHARDELDVLLATAARLRGGDLGATTAHRDALAKLRVRAANMLSDAGHAANEAMLRRVTTNLSAIAAAGGWQPDAPGALVADRAAPGFDAVGVVPAVAMPAASSAPAAAPPDARGEEARRAEAEQRRLAERARAEQLARARAERERVAAALRTARGDLETGDRRVRALAQELESAAGAVMKLRAVVEDLERKLSSMPE